MMRVFKYATILMVLSVFWVPWASADDLSADYLHGRWVIDEQDCSSPDSEYMEFNKNGTFEGTRTGQAEIVGFWGLKEGILALHMVTSPAFYDDLQKELAGFEGIYSYFQGRMVIFNTQNPNRLRSAARHNKLRAGGSGCETNSQAKDSGIGQAGRRRLHHAAGV